MMVIKKDGRLQNLEVRKIKTSILNAASDAGTILNEADVKILVNDVAKTIEKIRGENGSTSSYEIIGVLIDILRRDGFNKVVKAYLVYNGK